MKKLKILAFIAAFLTACCLLGTAYASWEFSGAESSVPATQLVIKQFEFVTTTWTDSNKLTEDAYEVATDFEYAMNNPESDEGQSWTAAWSSKNTIGNSYVGSMDKNAGDEISAVFHLENDPDASIIVKRKSNNEYYVYITYEKLNRPTGTVQPVYKTKYTRNSSGDLVPIQSWVGKCNRAVYSVYQLTTYSFNTESFTEI